MNKISRWSQEEIAILRECYATSSSEDLAKLLPSRTLGAIYNQAFQLRLKRVYSTKNAAAESVCPDCGNPKARRSMRCWDCHQKRITKPGPLLRSPVRPWEKEILLELGPRLTFVELRMLLPRRNVKELKEIAEQLDIDVGLGNLSEQYGETQKNNDPAYP